MQAVILSIGDELVLGQTVDTNAAWLSARLVEWGIMTRWHLTVADDQAAITDAILDAASEARLVLITGGLGPTDDDLTRQALAAAMNVPLVLDAESLSHIETFFRGRGRPMAERNKVQALLPRGARALRNEAGTAPGIEAHIGATRVFVMPGVPGEMIHLFDRHIAPALDAWPDAGDSVILTATLHCLGRGESDIAQILGDRMARDRNPLVGTTVANGFIGVRVRSQFPTRAQAADELEAAIADLRQALGPLVVGRDHESLPQIVGDLLRSRNKTLATAESCTAGLIGKYLTDPPGSSAYYLGGNIVYSNAAKHRDLDVPLDMLEQHGAVSEPVAKALAENVRAKFDVDYALAVTGIAGPTGGTPDKPVGLVYLALADRRQPTLIHRVIFPGDRDMVRDRTAKAALNMLRLRLLDS